MIYPKRVIKMTDTTPYLPPYKSRLMKDILRSQDELMKQQGIYYQPDPSNICKGCALIEGPAHTPYEGALLMFSFHFPADYPFSPPKVLFLTSDGYTRFHPNLYKEGKVCLSILGTYPGPSWSGTQSLCSVLLSLQGILDDNPLTHEPYFEDISIYDERTKSYADLVEHNLTRLMIQTVKSYEADPENHPWFLFSDDVDQILPRIKETLTRKVLDKRKYPDRLWGNVTYGMEGRSFWKKLAMETPWIS